MQSSKDNLISQRLEYGHQQALPTLRTNQVGDQSTGEITIVCEGGGAHIQEVLVYLSEGILSENGVSVMRQSLAVQMAWSCVPWVGDDACATVYCPPWPGLSRKCL